jgi:hypothetical protein
MRLRAIWMALSLILTTGAALAAPVNHPRPSTAWTPDMARLAQLAPEVKMPGFRIRPPKGYRLQQQSHGAGHAFSWVGATRGDGTRPYLMVLVMTPPPGATKQYAPVEALNAFLASIQQRRDDWQRSDPEQGTVNGREFVRARWSGVETTTQQRMRGFSYVTVDNGAIIQVSSQDVEPHDQAGLKLAETAALTFRSP